MIEVQSVDASPTIVPSSSNQNVWHVQVESGFLKPSSATKAGPSSSKPQATKKRRKGGDDEEEVSMHTLVTTRH